MNLFALELQTDAPEIYTVQSNDTVWSVSSRYLKRPWEWSKLWHAHARHPKKLYVGEVLKLNTRTRQPYLMMVAQGTVKLKPGAYELPALNPVPAIPLDMIQPFLNGSMVFDEDELTDAPYVVNLLHDKMLAGPGDQIYVENLPLPCQLPAGTVHSYSIFRADKLYYEPHSHHFLGFGARLMGHAKLTRPANPAKLMITGINDGIQVKDKVLPDNQPGFNLYFEPQIPTQPIKGSIIDILGQLKRGAAGLVVVLDRGKDFGLRPGDVLAIMKRNKLITDPIFKDTQVMLPEERAGELMIFRVFSQTSFALVVRANQSIHVKDHVKNP